MKYNIKKSLLSWVLVFSLVLPLLSSVIYTQAETTTVTDYHSMSMQEILARDESLTWVFAGDSITHNGNWSGGMNSYSEWFEQYLYDINRGDDSVVLTAWGGADTQDFLYYDETPSGNGAKADPGMGLEKMITGYNPDVVFIKLGMNDRGKTTTKFTELYNKILDNVYAEGLKNNKIPKIVILTPTPLASENVYDDEVHTEREDAILETILRYRDKLEVIANERGLLFCDLRTAFIEESKKMGEDYTHTFFSDSSDGGIHPNAAGQYCIFKTLSKAIGIYDETMPIFQLEYEDFLSQALYVDSTDGVDYAGSYGSTLLFDDNEEMNGSIPKSQNAQLLASVDFTSENGDFGLDDGETAYVDLVNGDEVQNKLTLEEVQSMGKEFSIVFRAKLLTPELAGNQPIFYMSVDSSQNIWGANSLSYSMPGQKTMYCGVSGSSAFYNSVTTWSNKSALADDNWHTFAIVQSEENLTVYVDGVATVAQRNGTNQTLSKAIGEVFADTTTDKFEAMIGKYGSQMTQEGSGGYQLEGNFDYWQLYDGVLSSTDVQALSGDDDDEMDKTMPTITGIEPLSSVEFTAESGTLATAGTTGLDITTDTEAIDALTVDDVKTIGKEFTVVFRAKLKTPDKANSPILAFSSGDLETEGWKNAFTLGVQGNGDQCYYAVRKNDSNKVSGTTFTLGKETTAGDGKWHTIAVVQTTDSFEYYVDGALYASNTTKVLTEDIKTLFSDATSLTARIGYYGSSAASYDIEGNFDYWQFYGQALSAENVAALMPTVDDSEEMNATMPTLKTDATLLASVNLNSTNGSFNGGLEYDEAHRIDLTDASICQDPLTLDEAKSLTNEFSIVFRARLQEAVQVHQAILMLSTTDDNWNNAVAVGVPSTSNSAYFEIRKDGTEMTNSTNVIGMSGGNQSVDGDWHTIAIVQSADSFTYYLDGKEFYTNTYKVNDGFNIGDLFTDTVVAHVGSFAKNSAKTYNLKAYMDYYQLYSGVLSSSEIASMAEADAANARTTEWSKAITENYVWGVAGAQQMSGYEGTVVSRSLFRYLDNAMRAGGNNKASQRDIRMFNLASPKYENGVQDLLDKYDKTMATRDYDVFLLLPEMPNVYDIDYVHSDDLVAEYKADVLELLSKNSGKVQILWTPLASGDATINGYINDYAHAIREIADADKSILFFDANRFMNDNMTKIPALVNNWFEDGAYVSPLCSVDVAYAFYVLMDQSGINKGELSSHNLRYTSDQQVYKGKYVRDYVKADAKVDGTTVTVDVSAIKTAYPDITNLKLAVMPSKAAGNYNANIRYLGEIASVAVEGNVYTFQAPCADLHLVIYGEQDGLTYRFKDISLTVETEATIPEKVIADPEGVYLNSLEVMSAPDLGFDKDTTTYTVDLYQYQTYARVRATAQAGLTITINGQVVASNALSELIKVENGSVITVDVSNGTETKTYTLNCSKPEKPDIIITEVMQDGYMNYTASGNDNYELVEIYNASGRDLNLLDYSLGFKKDYTYNNVTVSNGAEYPYYFTGNDQAFGGNASHTGIKPLTKYSIYWKDKVNGEPTEVIFPADSTMVIWLRYTPQGTQEGRETYGAALTYDTLIAALEAHKGTHTLTVDVDGTEITVVPTLDQLVVAELPYDCQSGGVSSRAQVNDKDAQMNYYMDNFGGYYNYQSTRGWLFILKDTAKVASNGAVTEDGDDIISAAKFSRAAKVTGKDSSGNDIVQGTNKLSSVFEYDYERGMALVKNENVVNVDTIGEGNTSDVMGYSNLTSFGAIEYWQKPTDFGDAEVPTIADKTIHNVASGATATIDLGLEDNADVRYLELYVRKAGETEFTKIAEDFVLEAGVQNAGVSTDITSKAYSYSVGEVTGTVEYYAVVVDGNNNRATLGSADEPSAITIDGDLSIYRKIQAYTATEAKTYIGVSAPKCNEEGFLFSGWYADEACETTPITSVDEVTETSYALFVADDVLSVEAQISDYLINTDATDDAIGSIRFITTVDSRWYRQVGFKVSYDKDGDGESTTLTRYSNKVYQKLYAVNATDGDTMEYYPDKEFCDISTYFKACTVTGVTENCYDMEFTVIPYWITPDGITVEGVKAVKTVNDGIALFYEAKDSTTYYKVFEDAVNAANTASKDSTITVLKDAEVESQMTVSTNVTIQNRAGRDITIYRGSGLAETNMFSIASGATLSLKGLEDETSLVLDGRTVAEANANTSRDAAAGSTGSLISNFGNLNIENITVQYVRKTSGTGGVINNNNDNATNANAMVTITDSVFDNNYSASYGSVLYSRAKATITGTTFTNNKANANGGVICHHSGTLLTVDQSIFENNAGNQGGVIWADKTFTVSNSTFKSNTGSGVGGAIHNSGANMELTNTTFESNSASGNGGAISNHGATPTITNCKFIKNISAGEGGAIYSGSDAFLTIIGGDKDMAIFRENESTMTWAQNNSVKGGGAICLGSGGLSITGYLFDQNKAAYSGGAIYITDNDVDDNSSIVDTNFTGNRANGNNGGGVYHKTKLTLTNCDFTSNYAANRGGGLHSEGGTLNATYCDFVSNTAKSEGGAYRIASGATATFENGKFENNDGGVNGGAIKYNSGTLTIINYVFTGNTADSGNAIKLNADSTPYPTLKNCTFNPDEVVDYDGTTTRAYTDGGGNTLVTDEE